MQERFGAFESRDMGPNWQAESGEASTHKQANGQGGNDSPNPSRNRQHGWRFPAGDRAEATRADARTETAGNLHNHLGTEWTSVTCQGGDHGATPLMQRPTTEDSGLP